MQTKSRIGALSTALVFLFVACCAAAAHAPTSLRQAFKGDFLIGAAINEAQVSGQDRRDTVERVTLWGVTDGDSWLNDWPVQGRTNYPLLFDRTGHPKPAYNAVLHVASETPAQ